MYKYNKGAIVVNLLVIPLFLILGLISLFYWRELIIGCLLLVVATVAFMIVRKSVIDDYFNPDMAHIALCSRFSKWYLKLK